MVATIFAIRLMVFLALGGAGGSIAAAGRRPASL